MKRIDFVLINLQGNAEKVFSAALSLIVLHSNPFINLDISNMKAIMNIRGVCTCIIQTYLFKQDEILLYSLDVLYALCISVFYRFCISSCRYNRVTIKSLFVTS